MRLREKIDYQTINSHGLIMLSPYFSQLDESARQMSCRVNQLKWRNKSLKMKKQGLEDKRVALIHENSRLEREIEELKATSRYSVISTTTTNICMMVNIKQVK